LYRTRHTFGDSRVIRAKWDVSVHQVTFLYVTGLVCEWDAHAGSKGRLR